MSIIHWRDKAEQARFPFEFSKSASYMVAGLSPAENENEQLMYNYLDFEKPVADLEGKILELKRLQENGESVDVADEIKRLEKRAADALRDIYKKLTPWQKMQVARHADRPHCLDFITGMFTDFTPLAGDRKFAEDEAIQCGLARFRGAPVAVIGQERGSDTKTRLKHNFGMAMPDGYRKAVRVMELADRFNMPIITLVDTPGAYPGIEAEERGQAEAIARSTEACLNVKVPLISVVIGEGGSGGAIAIATGNRVYMLEHAIYSVISPEGAASILWHDATRSRDAATSMKITAEDLKGLGIIDGIVPEPVGGAHRNPEETINAVSDTIQSALGELAGTNSDLRQARREKFLAIGRNL
jgi:acetyl-CoA carboxylase carboxyl transferase subunit alpha